MAKNRVRTVCGVSRKLRLAEIAEREVVQEVRLCAVNEFDELDSYRQWLTTIYEEEILDSVELEQGCRLIR